MKYQNVILISVFAVAIVVFYLISCQPIKPRVENVVEEGKDEKTIYYNVTLKGEFIRNGSYLIPNNWTVEMLFEYGGLKKTGDTSSYILTDLIEDNKEYLVPFKGQQTTVSNLININKASVSELSSLYGIGEVLAVKIIEYREIKPFTSIEEIKNINGIGDYVYEKIKDLITIW